ncbi:FABP family protein [Cellulomonas sp. ATA003]|uniref:FABP family protein n=1 Tax=Cellulomonas sp. ATA003 TaxID=3073064 RepID=UPI002873B98D|nr:FABP family protein [Cellulomonas sp. ATA003]WNB85891.1 FABP family protein [Cellulomonas sp. ATA003]
MAFSLPDGLAPEVYPLAWLVGRWRGEGVVGYPGIEEAAFTQDVEFDHDGGPYLRYTSTIRLVVVPDDAAALTGDDAAGAAPDPAAPGASGEAEPLRTAGGVVPEPAGSGAGGGASPDDGPVWSTESGFWRISSERPAGLSENQYPVEVLMADPAGHVGVYVGAVGNGRIDLVSDLIARTSTAAEVAAAKRLYGLVNGELMWAWDLAAFGHPMQTYASARLTRQEA